MRSAGAERLWGLRSTENIFKRMLTQEKKSQGEDQTSFFQIIQFAEHLLRAKCYSRSFISVDSSNIYVSGWGGHLYHLHFTYEEIEARKSGDVSKATQQASGRARIAP